MQSAVNEKEVRMMLDRIKQDLKELPEGSDFLDSGLESAAKHIPAYLKIIKGHIEQLAKVLELETHDHRKLENVGLASPVVQLMQLFRELNDDDIHLLETLAYEARHWQADLASHVVSKEATVA